MKQFFSLLLMAVSVMLSAQETSQVVIVYENDGHSIIDGYPKVAAVQKMVQKNSENVLTVSGGDFSTDFLPTPNLGRNTKGAGVIEAMNAIGYDFVAAGNHDFDFSVENLQKNAANLDATFLCCNFVETKTGDTVFENYAIKEIGGMKLAFIGATTPTAISRRNQSMFEDGEGHLKYSFCADTLPELIQENVNKARAEGAEYVILISHLGDKPNGSVTSRDVIEKTAGINVVLDAHAHSVIDGELLPNKNGEEVMLCSMGLKFANIGILTITKGPEGYIDTYRMVANQDIEPDAEARQAMEEIVAKYAEPSASAD